MRDGRVLLLPKMRYPAGCACSWRLILLPAGRVLRGCLLGLQIGFTCFDLHYAALAGALLGGETLLVDSGLARPGYCRGAWCWKTACALQTAFALACCSLVSAPPYQWVPFCQFSSSLQPYAPTATTMNGLPALPGCSAPQANSRPRT